MWHDYHTFSDYTKIKVMIVDFHRIRGPFKPFTLKGEAIEQVNHLRVSGFRYLQRSQLGVNLVSTINKAQQRLYFLHQLKKFDLRRDILVQFYWAVM